MHSIGPDDLQPSLQSEQNNAHAGHDEPKTKRQDHISGRWSSLAVPSLLFVLLMTLLSVRLMALPLNRLLELRYCLEYYQAHDPARIPSDGDIPESDCKVEHVQQRLGWIMGAFDTTMQTCGQSLTLSI